MGSLSGSRKQYANILRIDELIRLGNYPSVKDLAEVTELSERQVLRILKDMKEEYQAPIEYDKKHRGYCYLLDGYSITDISLDENESFALQVCNDFVSRVFSGSKLFYKLQKGISSLLRRAELFDNEEGKALATRIHFATNMHPMQFSFLRSQKDFEDILYNAVKNGQLLNVSHWQEDPDGEVILIEETCLPLMLIMHEDFTWVLFSIKKEAFFIDFTEIKLTVDSFLLHHVNSIRALNPYKNSCAKPVYIPNKISYLGDGPVGSSTTLTRDGIEKELAVTFSLSFLNLVQSKIHRVSLWYELDKESSEYKLADFFINQVLYDGKEVV